MIFTMNEHTLIRLVNMLTMMKLTRQCLVDIPRRKALIVPFVSLWSMNTISSLATGMQPGI